MSAVETISITVHVDASKLRRELAEEFRKMADALDPTPAAKDTRPRDLNQGLQYGRGIPFTEWR